MAQFTITQEPHRLHPLLSRKLARMRSGFVDLRNGGAAFEPEHIDEMVDDLGECIRTARDLEHTARQLRPGERHVNPDVAPISEALCQIEDAARAARRLVADRINEVETDPDGAIGAEIAKAARALMTVAAIVRSPAREAAS